MDRLLEYISHHPWYAGGLAVAALLVIVYELRTRNENQSAVSPQDLVRLMNQGALVIDLQILKAGDTLKKQKEKVLVVYDDTGSLGASAVRQLTAQGFTKAFNLRGGISAWRAENLPLSKA
jgi:rhodanese-related sulfurtransferase